MEIFMSYQFDHRQLADEMEIFFLNEEIGAGLPVWLPNGVAIRESLEQYIRQHEDRLGYQRVASPHIAKSSLYQSSGHLRSFGENMFPPMQWPEDYSQYYLRPMNCPHHHKIFASKLRSYRDLPLRVAEYGQVYRYENSGSLRGLSRVRGLCQNDAHIYLAKEDVKAEIVSLLQLFEQCYADLGLQEYKYRLSLRAQDSQEYDGVLSLWEESENILRQSLQELNLEYFESPGEAAFYGPKIDVQMRIGESSEESIASIQIDFNSAEKFDLKYIGADGEPQVPWIIHRAPFGSHERFIAMLLEYFDGQLPGWLSPVQALILPVNERHLEKAKSFHQQFLQSGIRSRLEAPLGSLSKRLHFARQWRPFMRVVIGNKELESGRSLFEFRHHSRHVQESDWIAVLKSEILGKLAK